jgi:hypothetical protein
VGVLGFLLVCLVVKATTSPFPAIETSHEQEQVFRTGPSTTQPFPSLGQLFARGCGFAFLLFETIQK